MTDPLKLLPPFQWRGVQYPVVSRSYSFAHESVQHKLQRRNKDLVEQTGAHNPVITVAIPMRDGLFPSLGYGDLFTGRLQQLLDDCRNRTPGELWDPKYGPIMCVPSSYTDDLDAAKRDGSDLRIEFREAPDEDEADDPVVTATTVSTEAAALNAGVVEYQATANEAGEISPNNSIALTAALSGLSSTGRAILATPNDARSELRKIEFWANEIEDIVTQSPTVAAVAVRDLARETRDQSLRALDNSLQIRPVRTVIVEVQQSVVSLAAFLGVAYETLLAANQKLANSPLIQPGTSVVVPDDG